MPNPSQPAPQLRAIPRLLLSFAIFASALPAQTPDLTQPKSLIHQNDLPGAEQLLRATLAANPKSPETLYLLASVLNRENKPKDSLKLYTEAAALRPPTSDDLRIVALDYVLLNDYPDAAHWLTRALDADPRNAEAWYSLGRVHMEQGDFIEAERNFHRALTLTPSDPRALDNLGLSLEAQNRSDEALAAYREAIAAQSRLRHPSEQPLLNLGTLLNSRSQSPEAIELLKAAVAYAPSNPRCHEELARSYAATGQDTLAIAEMQRAVVLDPANPRLHFQLGQLFRRTGMTAKADAELKTSASLYGSHSTPVDR